jgi:hypothetical protein
MPRLIDDAMKQMRKRTKPPLKPNTLKQYESACERLKENFADFEPRDVLPRHVVAHQDAHEGYAEHGQPDYIGAARSVHLRP